MMLTVGCGGKEADEDAIYKDLRRNMHWSFEKSPLSNRCYEMVWTYAGNSPTYHTMVMSMNEVTCDEARKEGVR
jgi:hypothetical protein